MIIVIADDITGAAELGGIGLRYGLRVRLADDLRKESNTDLLVVYTNTRSLPKEEAVTIMKSLTEKAKALTPSLFYKKTDSVLRGHVLAEMQAQMNVLDKKKALLVPVNPLLGRMIKDGRYFIQGKPVHQTSFSTDPEFPVRSADVKEMLGEEAVSVAVMKKEESLLSTGITVGEAETTSDVAHWAKTASDAVFCAGGASFFDALLQTRYVKTAATGITKLSLPLLLVSGTTFQKNTDRIASLKHLVAYMPDALFLNKPVDDEVQTWCNGILLRLEKEGKAIVAIGEKKAKADADLLGEHMSEVVKRVFQKTAVSELLIEGGSTAFAVIQKLGWHCFVPGEELSQGVVRMKVEGKNDVHLTIKPGSYEWPLVWDFN